MEFLSMYLHRVIFIAREVMDWTLISVSKQYSMCLHTGPYFEKVFWRIIKLASSSASAKWLHFKWNGLSVTYCSKLVETTGKLRVGEDQYIESTELWICYPNYWLSGELKQRCSEFNSACDRWKMGTLIREPQQERSQQDLWLLQGIL